MTKLQEVHFYIQEWNLTKLVDDDTIKAYVKVEREFEAREIVKGMVDNELLGLTMPDGSVHANLPI